MIHEDEGHSPRARLVETLQRLVACATLYLVVAVPASAASTASLNAMAAAVSAMPAYRASIALYERNGAREQRATYDYTYTRPNHATLHVVAGASAGYTLVWDGGTTVTAHKSRGLIGIFKKTVSLHDPLTTTIRASSVDELSFDALLSHVRTTPGTVREANGGIIGGVPTTAFTLTATSPARDGGYTREVVDVSQATHLPVRVLGYGGATVLRQVDFTNVTATR